MDQPEDRGILLRDVLESYADEKTYELQPLGIGWRGRKGEDGKWHKIYESTGEEKANCLTTATTDSMVAQPVRIGTIENDSQNKQFDSQQYRVYSSDGKSVTLCGQGGGVGAKTGLYAVPVLSEREMDYMVRDSKGNYSDRWTYLQKPGENDKGCCITANIHKGVPYNIVAEPVRKKTNLPIYEVRDGLITVKDKQYPIKLQDGFYIIRKLTVTECCRLQTLPDDYCRAVSASQAYKGLGNGWTAEVIIHILNGALKDVPRDEEIVVLSMYDGIGTGRYCLYKMGFTNIRYYAYEIDKYAKQIAMSNYPDIIQCGDAFDLRHPDWTIGY